MPNQAVIKNYELRAYRISLEGDGLVRAYAKPARIEPEDVEELMTLMGEIGGDEKVLLLINPIEVISVNPKARKKVVGMGREVLKAIAILDRKKLVNTTVNAILKLYKPPFPIKLFADEKEAENWLLTFDK